MLLVSIHTVATECNKLFKFILILYTITVAAELQLGADVIVKVLKTLIFVTEANEIRLWFVFMVVHR